MTFIQFLRFSSVLWGLWLCFNLLLESKLLGLSCSGVEEIFTHHMENLSSGTPLVLLLNCVTIYLFSGLGGWGWVITLLSCFDGKGGLVWAGRWAGSVKHQISFWVGLLLVWVGDIRGRWVDLFFSLSWCVWVTCALSPLIWTLGSVFGVFPSFHNHTIYRRHMEVLGLFCVLGINTKTGDIRLVRFGRMFFREPLCLHPTPKPNPLGYRNLVCVTNCWFWCLQVVLAIKGRVHLYRGLISCWRYSSLHCFLMPYVQGVMLLDPGVLFTSKNTRNWLHHLRRQKYTKDNNTLLSLHINSGSGYVFTAREVLVLIFWSTRCCWIMRDVGWICCGNFYSTLGHRLVYVWITCIMMSWALGRWYNHNSWSFKSWKHHIWRTYRSLHRWRSVTVQWVLHICRGIMVIKFDDCLMSRIHCMWIRLCCNAPSASESVLRIWCYGMLMLLSSLNFKHQNWPIIIWLGCKGVRLLHIGKALGWQVCRFGGSMYRLQQLGLHFLVAFLWLRVSYYPGIIVRFCGSEELGLRVCSHWGWDLSLTCEYNLRGCCLAAGEYVLDSWVYSFRVLLLKGQLRFLWNVYGLGGRPVVMLVKRACMVYWASTIVRIVGRCCCYSGPRLIRNLKIQSGLGIFWQNKMNGHTGETLSVIGSHKALYSLSYVFTLKTLGICVLQNVVG
ncbi:hypothetical protein Hanom_Chr01g00000571 [Helianthus anomalus]